MNARITAASLLGELVRVSPEEAVQNALHLAQARLRREAALVTCVYRPVPNRFTYALPSGAHVELSCGPDDPAHGETTTFQLAGGEVVTATRVGPVEEEIEVAIDGDFERAEPDVGIMSGGFVFSRAVRIDTGKEVELTRTEIESICLDVEESAADLCDYEPDMERES